MDHHLVIFFTAIIILVCTTNFARCGLDDAADEEDAGAYDFVIIGAGSGGSVLANRLSEVANWKILLVEAGKEEMFLTDIPLLAPILHITDYNWGYRTEPKSGKVMIFFYFNTVNRLIKILLSFALISEKSSLTMSSNDFLFIQKIIISKF